MPLIDRSLGAKIEVHAEDNSGKPIGWVYGYDFGDTATVGRIEVEKEHRRKGLGRQLWQAFLGLARLRGARRIVGQFGPEPEDEADAAAFYESLGVEIGQDNSLHQRL